MFAFYSYVSDIFQTHTYTSIKYFYFVNNYFYFIFEIIKYIIYENFISCFYYNNKKIGLVDRLSLVEF